ncbi:predicted protein [Nematostella vectensis]|uniref:Uncharacterized protein n=1 Tax=Nematostella vectensis TaxID=45351 RepID=A7RKN9_NEMVE|nr:predicted protein [Nematostella vectensis]|eukprot:XP_001640003.1 predicted protein [Nematostella vectensis]
MWRKFGAPIKRKLSKLLCIPCKFLLKILDTASLQTIVHCSTRGRWQPVTPYRVCESDGITAPLVACEYDDIPSSLVACESDDIPSPLVACTSDGIPSSLVACESDGDPFIPCRLRVP